MWYYYTGSLSVHNPRWVARKSGRGAPLGPQNWGTQIFP